MTVFLDFEHFLLKMFQKKNTTTFSCKGKLSTKRNTTPSVQSLNLEAIL